MHRHKLLGILAALLISPQVQAQNQPTTFRYMTIGPQQSGQWEYLDAITQTLGALNLTAKPELVHHQGGYGFPRNLAAVGPGRTMVMPALSALTFPHLPPARTMHSYFSDHGYRVRSIPTTINLSNVCYDEGAALIILAYGPNLQPFQCRDPQAGQFASNCPDKENAVLDAFGRPKNVIRLEADYTGAETRIPPCYDLDVYFLLARNANGKLHGLIHKDCILSNPSNSGVAGRAAVLQRLRRLKINLIEFGDADFNRLAGNGISPAPGLLAFPASISPAFNKKLLDAGFKTAWPRQGVIGDLEYRFGLRCLTLELPDPPKDPDHDEL